MTIHKPHGVLEITAAKLHSVQIIAMRQILWMCTATADKFHVFIAMKKATGR